MRSFSLRIPLVALVVAAGISCGFSEHKRQAEIAVDTFHGLFNDARYSEIYSSATPAFRGFSAEADLLAYLQAVRRKLGAFKTSAVGQTFVYTTTRGTFVNLTCQSQFDQDSAVEQFTFLIVDDRAVLQAYNINSRTLVVKRP